MAYQAEKQRTHTESERTWRGHVPYNWQRCPVSWNRWKIEVKELLLQRMSPTPKRQLLLKFSILKQTREELITMQLGKLWTFSDTRLCYCHYWHSSFIRPFWNFQKLSSSWKWYFQVNILLKKSSRTLGTDWVSLTFGCPFVFTALEEMLPTSVRLDAFCLGRRGCQVFHHRYWMNACLVLGEASIWSAQWGLNHCFQDLFHP